MGILRADALAVPAEVEEDAAPVGEPADVPAGCVDADGAAVTEAVVALDLVGVATSATAGVFVAALPPPHAARIPVPAAAAAIPLRCRSRRRLS